MPHRLKELVAHGMAQRIIDVLETVDIEIKECQLVTMA
jgi:hypothetical protein